MKLSDTILHQLTVSIRASDSFSHIKDGGESLDTAIKQACQLIEDQLTPYPNWDAIAGELALNQGIIHILKQCIHINNDNTVWIFDPELAHREILLFRAANKADLQQIDCSQVDNIQEKFLKSQLTAYEALTEMDMRRFVDATGMDQSIYVTTLNEYEIRAILNNAQERHKDEKEEYSIGLMINIGNEGIPPMPIWVAATLSIDPYTRLIRYKVSHKADLTSSPLKINSIEQTLEASVGVHINLAHSQILALPPHPVKKFTGYDVLHALYKEESLQHVVADQEKAHAFAHIEPGKVREYIYRTELEAITLLPQDLASQDDRTRAKFNAQRRLISAEVNKQIALLDDKASPAEQSMNAQVAEVIGVLKRGLRVLTFPGESDASLSSVDYLQYLLSVEIKFTDPQTKKKYYSDKIVFNSCNIAALEGLIAYSACGNTFPCRTLELDFSSLLLDDANQVQILLYRMKTLLISAADAGLPALNIVDNNHLPDEVINELVEFICHRKIPVDVCLPERYRHSKGQMKIDWETTEAIRLRHVALAGQHAVVRASTKIATPVRLRPRPKGGEKVNAQVDIELQEEQQVEVAIEASIEVAVADAVDGGLGDNYNIKQFCNDLRDGKLNDSRGFLQPCDPASAEALWMNWVGALTLTDALNNSVRLSRSACEELLQFYEFYQYGLDLHRLPPGFTCQPNGQITFDSALKSASGRDPLRIQTDTESDNVSLTFSQVEKILTPLNLDHPAKTFWNEINNGDAGYQREAARIFRHYLPQLLQLAPASQSALLSLCHDPHFNVEKFKFLLTHGKALKKALEAYPDDPNLNKKLAEMEAKADITIRDFILSYPDDSQVLFDQHPLSFLIDEPLKTEVAHGLLEAKDSPINLNALLVLYVERGEPGLRLLLDNQNEPLRQWMRAGARSYTSLLNPAFREALKYIEMLSPSDKKWWDRMLEQHRAAQPAFNLLDLVDAFSQFKDELLTMSNANNIIPPLHLPDNCGLEGVKSMPVALSRILTLVKKCKPENQQTQLNEASGLDLSSAGAIKTAAPSNTRKWAYLTPEMQLTRDSECIRHAIRITHFNQYYELVETVRDACITEYEPNGIRPREIEKEYKGEDNSELYRKFFRCVATQDGDQQLSLAFYRHVQETVDDPAYKNTSFLGRLIGNGPNWVRSSICFLMVEATTGDNRQSIFLNTTEANDAFDKFIKIMKSDVDDERQVEGILRLIPNMPNLGAITNLKMLIMLRSLTNLKKTPPLPTLIKLSTIIASAMTVANLLEIASTKGESGTIKKMSEAMETLNRYVHEYGNDVYAGLKDYTNADYVDQELFYKHLGWIKQIHDSHLNQLVKSKLITVISTFHLDKTSLEALLNRLESLHSAPVRAAWLAVILLYLPKMASRGTELCPLNAKDLNTILTVLENRLNYLHDEKQDIPGDVVAKTLSEMVLHATALKAYLPPDYIENMINPGISERVKNLIVREFPENLRLVVSKILLHFNAPGDNNFYLEVINRLIRITEKMDHIEKSTFLRKLNGESALFLPCMTADGHPIPLNDVHPFAVLLNDITENGPADFLNLLAAINGPTFKRENEAHPENRDVRFSHLSRKAHLYIKILVPPFRKTANIPISLLDLEPRIQATLLKTPPEVLDNPGGTRFPEEEHYERYLDILGRTLAVVSTEKADQKEEKSYLSTIDIASLMAAGKNFIEKVAPDNAAYEAYMAFLAEISAEKKLCQEKLMQVVATPGFWFLIMQLVNRGKDDDAVLQQRLEKHLMTHAGILKDGQLLQALLANPGFCRNLTSDEVMKDIGNPRLMLDDDALDRVFTALEKDVGRMRDFRDLTLSVQESVQKSHEALHGYSGMMIALFKKINDIAGNNPNAERQFLELYDAYLARYSPGEHGADFIAYISRFVLTLEKSFESIPDKNIVLSLCLQFNGKNEHAPALTPDNLLNLLDLLGKDISPESGAVLLKMAVALINNEKGYAFETFSVIAEFVQNEEAQTGNSRLATFIKDCYKNAPFPTMEDLLRWQYDCMEAEEEAKIIYDDFMKEKYAAFSIRPCHREIELGNGFHANIAKKQLDPEIFKGFNADRINLEAFETLTGLMRLETTETLLIKLHSFKGETLTPERCQELVAVAAELFYRSKGKDDYEDAEHLLLKPGSSMEINTTQYLAILTSLMTEGHVTSQIGTGEGKSRIMMIANACQFALGKTVDFLTSDAQLATRDYVEYQAYFEMIGAKISMIFAGSDPSAYCIGGINFSDPSNLSLFRNKARSTGREKEVIDPDPKNRALQLDEADKTYFDVANTRFNFSKEGDESIQGMEWIYRLLMEYFTGSDDRLDLYNDRLTLYFDNVDKSREDFLAFVKGSLPPAEREEKMLRLAILSNDQIEQWQVSAVTAAQLKLNEDFVIEPDILIATKQGPKIASEAQLLAANRVSKHSKLSFGVHQCLHARLNIQRQNLQVVRNQALKRAALLQQREDKQKVLDEAESLCIALERCEERFHVADEKQIIYSSTSKNLLDDYFEGTLKAVTGTAGSLIERQEAAQLYGTQNVDGTYYEMQFIDVPRDKGLRRYDHPIRLTGNKRQQIDVLITQIRLARAKHQPILVIAENDAESAELFEQLRNIVEFKSDIQHIHSQLSLEDEKNRIDSAGIAGKITISTDMIGRGTDIKLKGRARDHGLNVMITYLPRPRDLEQIIGRSGRAFDKGETSLVLDKIRLKKQLGKKTLRDGFYTHTEAYIKREQALMDRRSQCERLIKNTIGDFRRKLIEAFYAKMLQQVEGMDNQKKLVPLWTAFFDSSDKSWNELWPHIQQTLQKEPVDTDKITELLKKYESDVQKFWTTLRRNVQNAGVPMPNQSSPAENLAPKIADIGSLQLSPKTIELLREFNIDKSYSAKERVFDRYELGHEGRVVKYVYWWIPWIASAKGWANLLPFVNYPQNEVRRPLANFRAWAENHGILFPELRAIAARNKARIIGGLVGGVLCGAVGVALIATGILAPLGIGIMGFSITATSAAIVGAVSLVTGALVGMLGVAIAETLISAWNNRRPVGGDEAIFPENNDRYKPMGLIRRNSSPSRIRDRLGDRVEEVKDDSPPILPDQVASKRAVPLSDADRQVTLNTPVRPPRS